MNAFRVMRSDGLKPSILALNSLINAFGEDRRDAEAFSVLQYMKDNVSGNYISTWCCWLDIAKLSRMHYLCVQNLKPDVVTYTTLMKALVRVDKYEKVPRCYVLIILTVTTQQMFDA